MNYALITPLKDEETNLTKLKKTVLNQTIKPIVWVIVDSGSNDNTYFTSSDLFKDYNWIYIIKQKKFFEEGYGHLNFSQAINEGFEFIENLSQIGETKFEYVGKTDATPILCNNYFENLLSAMVKDNNLALTCGIQKFVYKDSIKEIKPIKNINLTALNDIRLYNVEFFKKIGGYPLSPSPDSVILIKAINRGWEVKIIKDTYFLKPRLSGSKIGMWNGAKLKGRYMYILGYHPLLALISGIGYAINWPPHYQFIPLIIGYLSSFFQQEEKVSDVEVRDYFGKKRLKEVTYKSKDVIYDKFKKILKND